MDTKDDLTTTPVMRLSTLLPSQNNLASSSSTRNILAFLIRLLTRDPIGIVMHNALSGYTFSNPSILDTAAVVETLDMLF